MRSLQAPRSSPVDIAAGLCSGGSSETVTTDRAPLPKLGKRLGRIAKRTKVYHPTGSPAHASTIRLQPRE